MPRRSGSYALYGKFSGCLLALAVLVGAALFYLLCLIAIHVTILLGRIAEPGLGRRTSAATDGLLAGTAAGAAWTVFIAALTAAFVGALSAFPYGLLFALPLGVVVAWEYGHWQTAVSWAHAPGAAVLGEHCRGHFLVSRPYTITPLERVKHTAVAGATGSGKSTLLRALIVQDLEAGAGLCVIDPKDDLVDRVLGHIPARRLDDVILFDATDTERPVGINPFAGVPPEQRSLAAAEILAVFRRYFSDAWGARLEHVLRHAVLALLETPDATLVDIPRLLMNRAYCQQVVAGVTNPAVRDFFLVEYEEVLRRRGDAIEPILNKVGPWLAYPELRNIIGQPQSAFDFRQVIDEGKVLFVRIPQGALGEDVSNLLGALVVAKIQLAAQSRVNAAAERRRRFYLYVDEFQNFATSSFTKVLTEARGFGLGLVCANQYPEQLTRDLQLAVSRNAATSVQCVYREGRHELLVTRQEDADARPKDREVFVVKSRPPLGPGDRERAAAVRLRSRQRYGRPVAALGPPPPPEPVEETAAAARRNAHAPTTAWGQDVEEE